VTPIASIAHQALSNACPVSRANMFRVAHVQLALSNALNVQAQIIVSNALVATS